MSQQRFTRAPAFMSRKGHNASGKANGQTNGSIQTTEGKASAQRHQTKLRAGINNTKCKAQGITQTLNTKLLNFKQDSFLAATEENQTRENQMNDHSNENEERRAESKRNEVVARYDIISRRAGKST